jgi:ribonucleoside-diphosphate reductase alpha chain
VIGVKIKQIRKRDGRVVDFDQAKITEAVFKAMKAAGSSDKKAAAKIAEKVVATLEKESRPGQIPAVEDVQDLVERILIEEGLAKIAKAYILYRQKRKELREEKRLILEKDEVDEVDKKFDTNALRVLKSRYLRKDENGRLIETPKQLFTRIATHMALPELFFDKRVFNSKGNEPEHPAEDFDNVANENKISIGKYKLNRFHLEAVKRLYDRASKEGTIKVSWSAFLDMLKSGKFDAHEKIIDDFYDVMVSRQFMPNTPAIANFGNPLGMGSACFVLGIKDSLESIFTTLKDTAHIHQAGGGTGFNFSDLRPEGDFVSTTHGVASGPMSFMKMFDTMTDVIKQGGMRRGANMGILNSNHPDIEKFITAKEGNKALRNFNISVLVMPDLWDHIESGKPYPLVNPRTKQIVKYVDPRQLFDRIVYQAWESAEPGVIFFDRVNEFNPFYEHLGPIVTTNPCGEVLLYPNEPCNLGSINVWAFVKENDEGEAYVDWDGMRRVAVLVTRLMDNVIEVNKWPLPAIEQMARYTRKIGIGVMGVGDMLFELSLPYNTDEGRNFMEQLMEFVNYWTKVASVELAKERGTMPSLDKSFYPQGRLPFRGAMQKEKWHFNWDELSESVKKHGIRNGYTTIIAPTGSISMIAGCSSGMEPVYSLVFEKNVKVGSFYYIDPVFEKTMRKEGLYDDHLMGDIAEHRGSIQNVAYIPPKLKRTFVTALDITPEDHIRALAAFQNWVDSSISKTNNFPADASVEYMKQSYILAYRLGCKDVTVFRDTSIKEQVLVAASKDNGAKQKNVDYVPERLANKVGTQVEHAGHTIISVAHAIADSLKTTHTVQQAAQQMSQETAHYTQQAGYSNGGYSSENAANVMHGLAGGADDIGAITPETHAVLQSEHAGHSAVKMCPTCDTPLLNKEGCMSCSECGYGLCSS